VQSGTKLDLNYYVNDMLDDEQQEEIFDYWKEAETDSIEDALEEFDGDYSDEEMRLMRIKFMSEVGN
jgi:ATP-dependent DNA helicase RecQ